MQRRRGLVSQPIAPSSSHALSSTYKKRARSDSESSEGTVLSDDEAPPAENTQEAFNGTELSLPGSQHDNQSKNGDISTLKEPSKQSETHAKGKKKGKRDMTDETRWQKMKVVGSEKEVMVDLTRIQKYVDHDSSTVTAFQSEVQSAKGNFRQQALADYSDL